MTNVTTPINLGYYTVNSIDYEKRIIEVETTEKNTKSGNIGLFDVYMFNYLADEGWIEDIDWKLRRFFH